MIKTNALFMAAALGAATLSAAPALANASMVRVSHADLDLTTQDGQDTLQRRLDSAASRACRFHADGALRASTENGQCYRDTRRQARVTFASVMTDRRLGG